MKFNEIQVDLVMKCRQRRIDLEICQQLDHNK